MNAPFTPNDDVHLAAPQPRRQGRVARNFAFSAISMLVATPLNVLAMLVLARRLGPEPVGMCFTVFAIAIVVYILSGMGVSTTLIRRIAERPEEFQLRVREAGALFFPVALLSVIVMAVCGAGWMTVQDVPNGWLLFALASAAVVFRHAIEFSVGAVLGLERFEFEMFTRVVQNGSFCLLAVTMVSPGPWAPVLGVGAFALSHLLAAIFIVGVLVFRFGCRQIGISREVAFHWLQESRHLGWGDAMRGLGWNIDSVVLGLVASNTLVGLYNVAYRPLMPLRILPRTLVSVTFPMMSRMAVDDRERLADVYRKTTALLWFISMPICLAVTASAEPFVVLVAGEDFRAAAAPLCALIWVTPLLFLTTHFRFLFAAVGELPAYSRMVTLSVASKIVLLLLLTPVMGLMGACAASLASEAFFALSAIRYAHQAGLGWPDWGKLGVSTGCLAVTAALLYVLAPREPLALATAGIVAAGVMTVLSLWLGAVDRSLVESVWDRLTGKLRPLFGRPAAAEPAPSGGPGAG